MTEKMKLLKRDSIARTICLLLALFNQALAVMGKEALPILEEDVYQLITLCLTMSTAAVAWWKNNSFTNNTSRVH